MKLCLLGAGGHGKVVAEAATASGFAIVAYADAKEAAWLQVERIECDQHVADLPADVALAVGFGAVDPEGLSRRLQAALAVAASRQAPPVIHPRAVVSTTAFVGDGSQLLAGSVLNAGCRVGRFAIINTGAIVEHDARIGDGVHIAPGAIILGGATVGDCSMIGAGAIVLPQAEVPPHTFLRAGERFPGSAKAERSP